MMQQQTKLTRKLGTVFERRQAAVLAEVITDAYDDLVKTSDFNELKSIVKELAQAQQRTGLRVEELAQAQKELTEAQKRTELRVGELAEAQKRTELRVEELAEAQKGTQIEIGKLAQRLHETNSHVGGLSRSVAYALENEAYRMLPALLKKQYGIEMSERLVRTTIEGEEINIFGRGQRNGQDVLLVGETKLRLDERRQKKRGQKEIFEQLAAKSEAVARAYPGVEVALLLITHFARPGILQKAEERGILVVQSFEW